MLLCARFESRLTFMSSFIITRHLLKHLPLVDFLPQKVWAKATGLPSKSHLLSLLLWKMCLATMLQEKNININENMLGSNY